MPITLSAHRFRMIRLRLRSLNEATAERGSTLAGRFAARKISRSSSFALSESCSLLVSFARTSTRVGPTAICMPCPEASGIEALSASQVPDSLTSQAEAELLRSVVEVRESGTWLALSASIPDAAGQGMQIAVGPTRVLVRAKETSNEQDSERAKLLEREIFLAANLPAKVDPLSAVASFKDRSLNLMIRKRWPDKVIGI